LFRKKPGKASQFLLNASPSEPCICQMNGVRKIAEPADNIGAGAELKIFDRGQSASILSLHALEGNGIAQKDFGSPSAALGVETSV